MRNAPEVTSSRPEYNRFRSLVFGTLAAAFASSQAYCTEYEGGSKKDCITINDKGLNTRPRLWCPYPKEVDEAAGEVKKGKLFDGKVKNAAEVYEISENIINERAARKDAGEEVEPRGTLIPFQTSDGAQYVCEISPHFGKDPRRILQNKPMGDHDGCTTYYAIVE